MRPMRGRGDEDMVGTAGDGRARRPRGAALSLLRALDGCGRVPSAEDGWVMSANRAPDAGAAMAGTGAGVAVTAAPSLRPFCTSAPFVPSAPSAPKLARAWQRVRRACLSVVLCSMANHFRKHRRKPVHTAVRLAASRRQNLGVRGAIKRIQAKQGDGFCPAHP